MSNLHHLYGKLKDIYLELPDFSYYHSPSGKEKDNPNLVGRKRIKRKLYTILTNSETRSGSYIITGFRGMGKTSLVNQVINQLKPKFSIFRKIMSILITWFVIHITGLFDIFDKDKTWMLVPLFLIIIFLYYLNYLSDRVSRSLNNYYNEKKKPDKLKKEEQIFLNKRGKRNNVKLFFIFLLQSLEVERKWNKSSNVQIIFKIVSYAVFIELVTQLIKNDYFNFLVFIVVFVLIIVLDQVSKYVQHLLKLKDGKSLRNSTKTALDFFKQRLNHGNKVFVRLSLAQDALESKDILKSVVYRMRKEYLNYSSFYFWISRILISIIILSITSSIYQSKSFQSTIQTLNNQSHIELYFPSLYLCNKESVIENKTDRIKKKAFNAYNEMIAAESFIYYESQIKNLDAKYILEPTTQIQSFTRLIDFYNLKIYRNIQKFFFPLSDFKNDRFYLIPHIFSIWYFLLLLIILGVILTIKRYSRFLGIVTNSHVKRLLKELNEKCLAEVSHGSGTEINVKKGFLNQFSTSLIKRKSKQLNFPISGSREIENDLIHIFDELDRIPKIFAPPMFSFVFDELDKIEPNALYFEEKGGAIEEFEESEKKRKKRELVAGIMATMKVFFTTAKAKFIFIAGREMYDASLADTSDRESYLGSIFHDIIYVSSLYKDPFNDHNSRTDKPIDISYLAEKYVCRLLLPDNSRHDKNLSGYSKYITDILRNNLFTEPSIISDDEEQLLLVQKMKVISILSKFIHYLTYRSKGSPMNLFKLFEDFIWEFSERKDHVFLDSDKLMVSNKSNGFFLHFDFQAQYRVTFVGSLFRPYLVETGTYLKYYSDKILVSTSYLLDHIYKFHEFGFSWRNLELLPEIIDINRAPLLRRHIEKIIAFLTDSSLKKIDNGLINFKFHRKVIEEIKYLTKRSDIESAIFNFTLDESLNVKRHYNDRLKRNRKKYSDLEYGNQGFINSRAFLESILGDLHFYDKEYDEAVIQYADAVQMLEIEDVKSWKLHEIFLFTKTMLRSALVFEKMNTYEPAFTKYSEIIDIVRILGKQLGRISEKEVKNSRKRLPNKKNKIEKYNRKSNYHYLKSMFENFSLMTLSILAKLVIIEKIGRPGITLKDSKRADKDFHTIFNYLKKDEKYQYKLEYHLKKGDILFYKNGILYDNYNTDGGGQIDEILNKTGFDNITPHRDYNAPFSAYMEYLTGAVLLMKKLNSELSIVGAIDDQSLENSILDKKRKKKIKKYKKFNNRINKIFLDKQTVNAEKELLISAFQFLTFNNISKLNISSKEWNAAGRLFSALGDCLLIICDKPSISHISEPNRLTLLNNPLAANGLDFNMDFLSNYSRTELGLLFFAFSGKFYERANEIRNYNFQKKKVLFTLKTFLKYFDSTSFSEVKNFILKSLLPSLIASQNRNSEFIIFPEISKLSSIIEPNIEVIENFDTKEGLSKYYRFSYNVNAKMTILHWWDLSIINLSAVYGKNTSIQDVMKHFPIDSYSNVGDQMVRIFELRFKSRLNRKWLIFKFPALGQDKASYEGLVKACGIRNSHKSFIDDDLFDQCVNENIKICKTDIADEIWFLVLDSIFCEMKVIDGVLMNEVGYLKGNSYVAAAYMSLGYWLEVFKLLLEIDDDQSQSKDRISELKDLIGDFESTYIHNNGNEMNTEYTYQKALSYYYKSINMHSEGDSFKTNLYNMYYTEGDFEDDNQHFCASMERLLINNFIVRQRITFIKNKLKEKTMFKST